MFKSYILGDKVNTINYREKNYIVSRPVDYVKKNVLDLRKQRVLVYYFYDLENHKVEITDTEQFESVCRKLCLNKGTVLNFLRLKESLENYECGSVKAKNTKLWKPNTIIAVRAVHTVTGEVVKVNTVRELSRIIKVSETSIRKGINTGCIVKNYRIIARHKEQN